MDIDKLWMEYKETNDKKLKNNLIEHYIELVKIVAGRMYNYYGSKVEYDDLIGYGTLGLIDSIEKYDIEKNIKFSTYAQIRIRGEMIDNVRKLDWIPRSLRQRSKEVQESIYKLENLLGRKPSNQEVADYLNIELNEYEEILSDISTFNVSSLEDLLIDQGDYAITSQKNKVETPESSYLKREMKEILVESLDKLDEREKLIISLYYYDELTYKEIGSILELSESRISQIHSKAILKIKNMFLQEGIENNV